MQEFEGITMSPTGIKFASTVTQQQWLDFGEKHMINAVRVQKSAPFWLGDFINHGEHKYGEKYAQALSYTDYDEHYLRTVAYACRQVKPKDRNENLTFSHHYAVARLPEQMQKKALAEGESERMNIKEFRAHLDKLVPLKERPGTKMLNEQRFDGFISAYSKSVKIEINSEEKKLMRASWDGALEFKSVRDPLRARK